MGPLAALAWVVASTLGGPTAQDEALRERIGKLVEAFSDDSKEAREKAVVDLIQIGRPALEALKKAAESRDLETRTLAQSAIDGIDWGQALGKLKQYVKDRFEDGASPEPLKLKAFQKWFPEAKFYEVSVAPAAGVAVMGMGGPTSIFAIRRNDPVFYRIMVKGIFAARSFADFLQKEKLQLPDHDAALDFATTFLDLYWASMGAGRGMSWSGGMASRFDKTEEGWELQTPNYGTHIVFKTDSEGRLVDIGSGQRYPTYGPGYSKLVEEKAKLDAEKTKLEIELLKRQIGEFEKKK